MTRLLLPLIVLFCHARYTSTMKQVSSNKCNTKSLKDAETNVCDPTKIDVLTVSHASGCGDTVPQAETTDAPTIKWEGANTGNNYVVVMLDPDAPPKINGKAWLHWIRDMVPGNALAHNKKIEGKPVGKFDYRPPTPPPGTGTHRYFTYVFESTGKAVTSSQTGRGGFSLEQFLSENGICKLTAMAQYKVDAKP